MAEIIIKDGSGTGSSAHVDPNHQIHTLSRSVSIIQDAVGKGNAYNINTGLVALTSATESGVLYFKNDESPFNGESSFIVDAIAVGIDDEGTTTGMSTITIVRNPTGGTLISGASDVAMNENRNFGSSTSLSTTSLAYKGVEGSTVTGGTDFGIFLQQPGTRGLYTIDVELPKGASFAVKIDTDTSGGTTNVYVAIIGHRKDGNNA